MKVYGIVCAWRGKFSARGGVVFALYLRLPNGKVRFSAGPGREARGCPSRRQLRTNTGCPILSRSSRKGGIARTLTKLCHPERVDLATSRGICSCPSRRQLRTNTGCPILSRFSRKGGIAQPQPNGFVTRVRLQPCRKGPDKIWGFSLGRRTVPVSFPKNKPRGEAAINAP